MREGELRRRLAGLRAAALDKLIAEGISPEMLTLLSSTTAAIGALDARPAGAASKAIVADDGAAILLTLRNGAAAAATITLTAPAAIGLAGRLLQAAELRELAAAAIRKEG